MTMKGIDMDWQPIETAPKDRDILLFCPRRGVVCGEWEQDKYSPKPRPFWSNDKERLFGTRETRADQPTHWKTYLEKTMDEITVLTDQLDDAFPRDAIDLDAVRRAVKDAARYRWLRGRVPGGTYRIMGVIYSEGGKGVDAAIDVAMSSNAADKGPA